MPLLVGARSPGRGVLKPGAVAVSLPFSAFAALHLCSIRSSTRRAAKVPSSLDSSSLLLVDTVLHVLGEDPLGVLTGLVTTTGNDTLGTVSTSHCSSFGGADDFAKQQPIIF